MNKKRVLHIITRLISGGADENTLHTVRKMDPKKYAVDLAVGGESDANFLNNGAPYNLILLNDLKRNIHPWRDIKTLFEIYRLIKKNRYDIVHTHTAKAGVLGRIAAFMAGTPVIIHTLHGITFHRLLKGYTRWLYIFLEKLCSYFTDIFITVGEDLKQKYIERKIGTPDKFVTIHSGFELQQFAKNGNLDPEEVKYERNKLGISPKDIVLGSVSRLEPRKGHVYLFDALTKVIKRNPNIKLLVAGNGAYEANLKTMVKEKNIAGHVIFLGYQENIARVMRLIDIFTLTSLWEGLPRVLVQAALMEIPIVTFDVEGAWEVVKENKNGFIVPTCDVDLFAERLTFFIENPEIAKEMGKQGRNVVTEDWDVDVMVRKITDVYENLLTSTNGK